MWLDVCISLVLVFNQRNSVDIQTMCVMHTAQKHTIIMFMSAAAAVLCNLCCNFQHSTKLCCFLGQSKNFAADAAWYMADVRRWLGHLVCAKIHVDVFLIEALHLINFHLI